MTSNTDFLTLCRTRCSVRAYQSKPIAPTLIMQVMEAVRLAPSAVNYQPWHFYYVHTPEKMEALHKCYPREWFSTAPACFIV